MLKKFVLGASFSLGLCASAAVGATAINVQFAGQWTLEGGLGRPTLGLNGGPVTSLPVDFVASVIFDPTLFKYVPPPIYEYVNPDGSIAYSAPMPFSSVVFAGASTTSSATPYGVANPYASSGIASASGIGNYYQMPSTMFPYITTPTQALRLGHYSGSSQPIPGGSANWQTSFSIEGPMLGILPVNIGKQGESDFLALIQNAFESGTQFDAFFSSYTYLTSPGLVYPTALSAVGSAHITSISPVYISPVPEPEQWALLILGIAFLTAVAKRKRSPSGVIAPLHDVV